VACACKASARQHAGTPQPLHLALHLQAHVQRRIVRQLRAHALLQLLNQAVGGQAIDAEPLIVLQQLLVRLKAHLQAVAQKAACGMAQKVRQSRQRQRHFGVGLEGSHDRQHLRCPLFMRAIPFAGKG